MADIGMKFINVIFNADHPDPERLDKLIRELDRQGVLDQTDIYPCIRGRVTVEASINASHKMLVRMAKERNLPQVCIMEDDVCFPAKDGFAYWMTWEPENYDIYLAGTYGSRRPCLYPIGLHCYLIRSRFYDAFLNVDPTKHIDTALEGLGKFEVCYPMAAVQRPGWSANNKKPVNFNRSLKPEDVYREPDDPDFFTTSPDY